MKLSIGFAAIGAEEYIFNSLSSMGH